MRKVRLFPEDLRVETFSTIPEVASLRGTVHARTGAVTCESCRPECPYTYDFTCTCVANCEGTYQTCPAPTCFPTCPETCEL